MDRSTAKRFEEMETARSWLAETFAEWEAALTEAERFALDGYKRSGYRDINEALRFGDLGSGAEELVEDLDVALARMRLPEPVITWRGSIEADLYEALETLPGDIIEDAGYVSTSLLRQIAEGFTGQDDDALLVEIAIPGGASVGAFTAAPDLVVDLREVEIMLPRGSQFLVTGTDREPQSVLYLEVIL